MRFVGKHIAIASLIFGTSLSWGQSKLDAPSSLLVRMSFTSTWVADFGVRDSPQVCFSIDHAGHYQMRRLTMKVSSEPLAENPGTEALQGTPHAELIQGTLQSSELEKLEKLLADQEFRKLTVSAPNFLTKGAETFVAEVPRDSGVQRVVMSDADGKNPFPRSAEKIVNWLQTFKAEGSKPIDVSARDICPQGSIQPVRPATALLQPSAP
jgi:hypothetical protein